MMKPNGVAILIDHDEARSQYDFVIVQPGAPNWTLVIWEEEYDGEVTTFSQISNESHMRLAGNVHHDLPQEHWLEKIIQGYGYRVQR